MNLSEISYSTRTLRPLDFKALTVENFLLAELMRAGEVAYSQRRDRLLDGLIHELHALIWAEKVQDVVEESELVTVTANCSVEAPSNWWQAFRERWLPKWWLKRHPVRFTKHVGEASRTVRLEVKVDCSAVYLDWKPIGEAPFRRLQNHSKQVIEWGGFRE